MKTRIILFLLLISIGLLITGYFVSEKFRYLQSELDRQTTNVKVLNKNFKSYKNAFGQSVAEVQALTYKVSEFKENEVELTKKLLTNNVKPKNVKSVTQIGTASHIEIKTEIQYVDTTKCFAYENAWYTVNGCFDTDSASVTVETRDSLDIIPEIVPKHRLLWWSWGQKGINLKVISNNPFSKFTYLKYIEIKK